MGANIPGVSSPNANQPDVSKSSDTHVNKGTIVGEKKEKYPCNPIKIGLISRGDSQRGPLSGI